MDGHPGIMQYDWMMEKRGGNAEPVMSCIAVLSSKARTLL